MGFAVAAAVIIVAPLSLLLAYPHGTFNMEWGDSLWFIAYDRAYITSHFAFPATLNFTGHVGVPRPIFYGPLLYPILGLLAEPLGPGGAIRLLAVAIWLLQFVLVYRLVRAVGRCAITALAAAALMSWSVYSLTNLYNRGAIAEFAGTGFLLCAIAAGGLAILESSRQKRVGFGLLGALCAAVAIGSHGPTALVGGLVLLLLTAAFAWRRVGSVICIAAIVLTVVSPWLYVAAHFSGQLSIQEDPEEFPTPHQWKWLASNDSLWARFKPLPLAGNSAGVDPNTPYLDANWNFPLALLAAWNAALAVSRRSDRKFLPLMICSGVGCAVLLVISVSPMLQDVLPHCIPATIQFPYRLVSHANILLFTLLISAWAARSASKLPPRLLRADRLVLIAVFVLSAVGLEMKLYHAAIVAVADGDALYDPGDQTELLSVTPGVNVGQNDFSIYVPERAIPPAERASAARLNAPNGLGPEAEPKDATFDFPDQRWVVSSVLNFPWSHLIVDGQPVPFDQVHNLYFHQAVNLPPGPHTFGYRFEPDPVWVWLTRLSWTMLSLLAVATAICFLFPFRRPKTSA